MEGAYGVGATANEGARMLNPFANRKLLKRGETARARIVKMSTPGHGAEPSKLSMTLAIDFRGGLYEVNDRWMVPGTEPIGADSEIWVAVDPEDRRRVAIDWDRTRADYDKRTDPRRQVFAAGIPVPVAKVKAALEQAGELTAKESVDEAREVEEVPTVEETEIGPTEELKELAYPATREFELAPLGAPPDPLTGMSLHERQLLAEHPSLPVAETLPIIVPPVPVPTPVPAPKRRRSDVIKAKPARKRRAAPSSPPPGPVAPAKASAARSTGAPDDDDLTSKLERLAALHVAGSLTDGEFSAAKAHVLASG